MTGDRARSALAGSRFADLRHVAETGSTNSDLLDLARSGSPEGVVLVADHQTAGRGRLGRRWAAPPGSSLLMSVLLRPSLAPEHLFSATMAVGVSAVDACRDTAGVAPSLKWPNDLIVSGDDGAVLKVGGMLTESVFRRDRVDALVVGIGINVNWPDDLPHELVDIATSLNHLAGRSVDRDDLLVALLGHLDTWRPALYDAEGRQSLRERYVATCATLGRRVRADLADGAIEGRAVDISVEGHLMVESASGERGAVVAADVVHLR
jgi:BirA family biotin operon repressor/biotin-[acetyl-CoA-carboxylase] ligase